MLSKRGIIVLAAIMVALIGSQALAEITLKKTFFGGWKYSTDGAKFKKVGFSGTDLRSEMEGNQKAQSHIDKYKGANTVAMIFAVPGGFLIGWPIGGYIGSGGEWEDGYTTMMAIGAPLAIISLIFEGTATSHLKKAVTVYNGEGESLGFMLDVRTVGTGGDVTPVIGLSFSF